MDAGEAATAKAEQLVEKELTKVYRQAIRELKKKIQEHAGKFAAADAEMREKMANGEITPTEYAQWQRLKVWQGEQWQDKLDRATEILAEANREALELVNGARVGVFAQNASYQNFAARQAGIAGAWDIYDEATVARILAENPRLLPKKKLNASKDKTWNRRGINNCILQGIIQGESIPQISKRIADFTGSTNRAQMIRTARTAMTSAQNAGRIEAMHNQQSMGITVMKKWIATLDKRTRDAHQHLDGQLAEVDEPFTSDLGDIMFPGDPEAAPGNIYNCRCCLGYEYPGYATLKGDRRDQETGEVIADMTFDEWQAAKKAGKLPDYDTAKKELPAHEAGNEIPEEEETPEEEQEESGEQDQASGPIHRQFTPAETRADAEQYAAQFAREVSYKGIVLEYANTCNRVLGDVSETFGVTNLGTIQPMNMRSKLFRNSTSDAAYRWGGGGDLFINPNYYGSTSALSRHIQQIDDLMQTVLQGGQNLIDSGRATGSKRDYIEALLQTGRQCVSQSYDFVEGTFVHECGHRLDDQMFRSQIREAFGVTNIGLSDALSQSRRTYGGGISGYAISNNQEYVAESFTAWWYGETDKIDPVLRGVFESAVKRN